MAVKVTYLYHRQWQWQWQWQLKYYAATYRISLSKMEGEGNNMSPIESVKSVLSQYATFSGRASRSEFWWFQLALIFCVVLAGIVSVIIPIIGMIAYLVVAFGSLIPNLAVWVRRLHDTNRSGWWYLLAFVPFGGIVVIVWCIFKSSEGTNNYGSQPGNSPSN